MLKQQIQPLYLYGAASCDSYSSDAYGSGSFNHTACQTTTSPSPSNDGALAFTGSPYFVPIAAGVLLIVLSVAILFWGRKKRK